MQFFEDIIKKRFLFVSEFKIELVLMSISFLLLFIAIFLFFTSNQKKAVVINEDTIASSEGTLNTISIDIEGAVEQPGFYELAFGARLKDGLIEAGGLSALADRAFFSKHFNLSKILEDQEKIYIPTSEEVVSGYDSGKSLPTSEKSTAKININTSSQKELESLPGIGPVSARKIIEGRPYVSIEDVLNKEMIGESLFEKIKEYIIVF